MATTYTATIDIRCWKEHSCANCGAIFSYEFIRKIKGQGPSKEKAQSNAQAAVKKALEQSVDLEPCPTCGLYQPDMIGQQRAGRHRVVFWLALAAFLTIVLLYGIYVLQANIAVWAALGACALAAFAHWAIDLSDLNRDIPANRQLAEQRAADGRIKHQSGQSGRNAEELSGLPRSLANRLGLAMLLAAIGLAAAPEILRLAQHWPLNRECYPPVLGPGDQARIYMTDEITSVKGYWRGQPEVAIHQRGGTAKPLAISASTNQSDWGSTIRAKSSEKRSHRTPWVLVCLPADAGLAGKTETCDIDLKITFPVMSDSSNFITQSSVMRRSLDLQLASSVGAGQKYSAWWWEGTALGMLMASVCGQLLIGSARGLRRLALPTRILTPNPPAPADPTADPI